MPFIADDPTSWGVPENAPASSVEILNKIAELLADPGRWRKDSFHDGGTYCLVGAFLEVVDHPDWSADPFGGDNYPTVGPATLGVAAGSGSSESREASLAAIYDFNDDAETTHAMVLDVISVAMAILERG